MRILAIGITFCLVFYTVCVSDQNDYDADDLTSDDATKAFELLRSLEERATVELLRSLEERATVNGDQNDYDAGIAAYKRGHYSVAFFNFESRAMEDDPVAQFCLSFMYKHGKGVAVDEKEAKEWYRRAADQDYAPAQNNLGVMLVRLYEESDPENRQAREKALEWFRKAADQGYLHAQNNLGVLDHMRLKWWEQAASEGYAASQRHLGVMYHEGDGVKQNFAEAVKWHIKAAEQGDPMAQHNLGLCYAEGLGIKKDLKAAFRWYEKAAAQGYASGEFQVAKAYQYGSGTDKNPKEALEWYKKAAAQNHCGAQNNLAALYSEGETVLSITDTGEGNSEEVIIPQNLELARRWMLHAAQQGHPIPQKNIADNFASGKDGMPQDFAEAYYWYSLALKNKDLLNDTLDGKSLVSSVTEDRERVGNQLGEATKRKIQAQIDNWEPKIFGSSGTGFYIDENYILTNSHVVTREDSIGKNVRFDEYRIPWRSVELVVWDPELDLALLYDKGENKDTTTAIFRSQHVKGSEKVSVFGYPQSDELSYDGNHTDGIVSGLSDTINAPQPHNNFQHTAPTQRGNSGGPVFDAAGNVIGVSVSVLPDYYPLRVREMGVDTLQIINIAQNINFAIKFDVIKDFLDSPFEFSPSDYKDFLDSPFKFSLPDYKSTENLGKDISLEKVRTQARKFTVPVVCWKNKEEKPLSVIEVGIDELK